jgi:vitamin B12/bleomycin/antimicrobial peptide transport system ATP-binding/permease protein
MDAQAIPLKVTAARFVRSVKLFAASEFGKRAKLIFLALAGLLCAATGLNVANSYVGRHFMTAIANRDSPEFARQAVLYIGVFAASTVVAVIARFGEERLGLLWRESITRGAIRLYLDNGAYYRLEAGGDLPNADQRIAEDVKTFTTSTLSFALLLLNGTFTIIAFSGVLWEISQLLFAVAVIYAALGSYIALRLGRPLVRLNYDQFDKEAGFRSALTHVRENAEPVLFAHAEARHEKRLLALFDDVVANFRLITTINRNVGFFTTGYNWLIQIIPALIVAPAFFRRDVEFGVITQSAMAFSTLVAAFSLIVTQFQALTTYAAVTARLSALIEAVEEARRAPDAGVETVEGQDLSFENLSLASASGEVVLKDLTATIPLGRPTLVAGPNPAAALALFWATAGASLPGSGRIRRPAGDKIRFIPQTPYLPPCALREIFRDPGPDGRSKDEDVLALLKDLGLSQIPSLAGGLDREQDWGALLPLPEQHLLVVASVLSDRPQYVVLDRIGTSLGADQSRRILVSFMARDITYICCGETAVAQDLFDTILECHADGSWSCINSQNEHRASNP